MKAEASGIPLGVLLTCAAGLQARDDLNVALLLQDLNANVIDLTLEQKVDGCLADPQATY